MGSPGAPRESQLLTAILRLESPLGASRAPGRVAPVNVSRAGCSIQLGRASAPMMPQAVHIIRGPNHGTGTSSGQG